MSRRHPVAGRLLHACAFALLLLAFAAPSAFARTAATHHDHLARGDGPAASSSLAWAPCADAAGFDCATAQVPKDYARPRAGQLSLALVRLPATDPSRRVGSLFVNFGGPGGDAVSTIKANRELFSGLNDRFDIVGFDPRGVGESTPSIDCKVNQETQGVYRQPFPTPDNLNAQQLFGQDQQYINRCVQLNGEILPYVSTANVARDMDYLRGAVGDQKLTYLGFSYGTFLGATYQSMFPNHVRALVLDGALDPDTYINDPLASLDAQSAGFERATGRFLQACAVNQVTCEGFGSDPSRDGSPDVPDPWEALDRLIAQADARAIPATSYGPDPRPVGGDDIRAAVLQSVYSKSLWPYLAAGLARADQNGDAGLLRQLTDIFYGRNADGSYDPLTDRYFTIGALEQRYPQGIGTYLKEGARSYYDYDHAWFNHGYVELAWGLYPINPRGVFYGPFRNPNAAAKTLVVGTTYDPATPYKEAKSLVRQLGNAQLLTMRGDGHTAYGGNSTCIDATVNAYFADPAQPLQNTSCAQQVPFAVPQAAAAKANAKAATARISDATLQRQLKKLVPRLVPLAAR
jgi:pimeloyl-ACP methyl ester carboxylesterase